MKTELGEIIAERFLWILDQDGDKSVAKVLLGRPLRKENSKDVVAPYQIDYCGKRRLWYAAGIDGFQALQLAMKMINVELEAIKRADNVTIIWEGDASGKLGFDDA